MLDRMHRYWEAANFLCVGHIYLFENPLLREPLTAAQMRTGAVKMCAYFLIGSRSLRRIVIACILAALASIVVCDAPALGAGEPSPQVAMIDRGARIDDVSIEAYGFADPVVAMRYLFLRPGNLLDQRAVERDYTNLTTLAGLRTRLEVHRHAESSSVSLHWILLGPRFSVTDHPFYGDQPLSLPIEGFGFVLTSHPLDNSGATLSVYSQVALRAQLARFVYTKPLWIDAKSGREGDLIVNTFGARGVFRESQPVTQDDYSWATGNEVVYLTRSANGLQVEFGFRNTRSTSSKPTYLSAPSLNDTYYRPARDTTFEVGISRRCPAPSTQWYPPYCYVQYRAEAFDSIGGLGATAQSHAIFGDVAQYNRIGASTLVLHGALNRTGGVLPTSELRCAYTFGYADATCGTDTDLVQAEFRIADARPGPLKFVLFTETAASRIRGSDQALAPSRFAWRADSGVGVMYRGFRFNVASGNQGRRITYEVRGQLF